MRKLMRTRTLVASLAVLTLACAAPVLYAQAPAGGSQPMPPASWDGRMSGGPGMSGMMGGNGSRYGGSMGGMGTMMGMMGIGGQGMMGMGPYYMLDLSEQQRNKITQIQDEMRKKNWDTVGKLMDEQARLRDLYAADKRDPAVIGKQSMKLADLRRQLIEASVDAHNRIEALLGKEQKERLRRFGPGWMMDGD